MVKIEYRATIPWRRVKQVEDWFTASDVKCIVNLSFLRSKTFFWIFQYQDVVKWLRDH